MNALELKTYEMLKAKLGEKEAETFFTFLDERLKEKATQKQLDDGLKDFKDIFATKQDLAEVKADIIKWMFIFWVGQLAATFALIKLL